MTSREALQKESTPEEFAQTLKWHRERLALTASETAAICHVPLAMWEDWEAARGPVLHPTVVGVCEILKFTNMLTAK